MTPLSKEPGYGPGCWSISVSEIREFNRKKEKKKKKKMKKWLFSI